MTSPAAATPVLPGQVSPPRFALSDLLPGAITGVEVVAIPVLPGSDGGAVLLGPGAAELVEEAGLDLPGIAEIHGLTGATAEVATVAVPGGSSANPDLRLVLLVGVGAAQPVDLRRAGAAVARATWDRSALATSVPTIGEIHEEGFEAFVAGLSVQTSTRRFFTPTARMPRALDSRASSMESAASWLCGTKRS